MIVYLPSYPVEDVYVPDQVKEAVSVFGADDPAHPAVAYLRNRVKELYVGGSLQAIKAPTHFDYVDLRCTSLFLSLFRQQTHPVSKRYAHRTSRTLQEARVAQGCRFPNS